MKTPETLSFERAELRSAIEVKAAAELEVEAARAARVVFERDYEITEGAYYDALREVEKAKTFINGLLRANAGSEDALSRHAADYGEPHPRARLRVAEEALAEARERFHLAEEGRAIVRGRVANAEAKLRRSLDQCEEAISAVEVTAYPELLAKAHALFEDLFRRRHVLLRLAKHLPDANRRERSEKANDLCGYIDANDRLPSLNGDGVKNDEHRQLVREALAPWDVARAALLLDADAPLPGGE